MAAVRCLCWFGLTPLLLGLCTLAYAQGNDLASPTGGRSALMGNTGVALGRDGAAPFNNPAAIVRIRDESLAFSVNYYSLGIASFERWHQPGPVAEQFGQVKLQSEPLSDSSFHVLPSTLCLFFTLADLVRIADSSAPAPDEKVPGKKLAICFATLESEDVDLQAIHLDGTTSAGPTTQVQGVQRRWARRYIGPTYSFHLGEDLALGFSLQGAHSYQSFGVDGSSISARSDAGAIASTLAMSGTGFSLDLVLLVGATYRLGALTLGASLRAPALHLFGHYSGTFQRSVSGSGDQDAGELANGSGWLRASPPMRAAIGGGLSLGQLTMALDLALVSPVDSAFVSEVRLQETRLALGEITQMSSRQRFEVRQHPVLQPSFGAEYFTSQSLSLLAGASANLNTLGPLRVAETIGNLVQARIHHVSAAFGVGSHWRGGELLLGIQLDYGWGQALAINPYTIPNAWTPADMHEYRLTFVISGATDLKSILRLVKQVSGSS